MHAVIVELTCSIKTGVVKGTMDATITLSNSDNVPTTMLIEDDHGDSQLLNVLMASKVSMPYKLPLQLIKTLSRSRLAPCVSQIPLQPAL
jgi:hypothetical protein